MNAAVSTDTPALAKGRGRPSKSSAETPQQRVQRLEAELVQAKAAMLGLTKEQAAIIGQVVMVEMQKDADFRRQVVAILRANVKRQADRDTLSDIIAGE